MYSNNVGTILADLRLQLATLKCYITAEMHTLSMQNSITCIGKWMSRGRGEVGERPVRINSNELMQLFRSKTWYELKAGFQNSGASLYIQLFTFVLIMWASRTPIRKQCRSTSVSCPINWKDNSWSFQTTIVLVDV